MTDPSTCDDVLPAIRAGAKTCAHHNCNAAADPHRDHCAQHDEMRERNRTRVRRQTEQKR